MLDNVTDCLKHHSLKKVGFYVQFVAIQKHQARDQIIQNQILFLNLCWKWTSDHCMVCHSFTHCAIEIIKQYDCAWRYASPRRTPQIVPDASVDADLLVQHRVVSQHNADCFLAPLSLLNTVSPRNSSSPSIAANNYLIRLWTKRRVASVRRFFASLPSHVCHVMTTFLISCNKFSVFLKLA